MGRWTALAGVLVCSGWVAACDGPWKADELPPDQSVREVSTPADCPTNLPGTDEELAHTPRIDAEAERLAIFVGDGFTADPAVYERLRRDLAAIRDHVSELADVHPQFVGDRMELVVSPETLEAMRSGTYHDWDCLNARYGWTDPELDDAHFVDGGFAIGSPVGRYRNETLLELYRALPGVGSADFGSYTDGPTICVTPDSDGSFHYVFDAAGGDCPSGCTEHHESYFVTQADGRIEAKGETELDGGEVPSWATTYGPPSEHCP